MVFQNIYAVFQRTTDWKNVVGKHANAKNLVIFKACHSGKLKLEYTSPNIISTSPKTYWWAELISQFFCYLNSSQNFTCRQVNLSDKLRTKFTNPIAKSTSLRLSDTTFFAHWYRTLIFMISELFEWWNWAGRSQVTMTCLKEVSLSVLTKI